MDKLGLHIVEGFSGPLCKSDGTPPRLVKLVDASVGYVRQVRAQVGPRCVIIIRWYEPEQPLVDPTARARQWFERRRAEMLLMREAAGPNIAFESYNEIADHQAAAYCQFEVERLALMHAAGLHSIVGNFSVGTPDLPTWDIYRPMLHAMREGDLLGLHEYWSDSADLSNMWHVGRWRLLPQLDGIPIVVTECGRDVVEGQGAAGWRRTCNADEFLADLRAYNSILMEQDRVLGATVFTGGRIYSDWEHFNVNDIWPRVIAEYNPNRYADQQPAPAPKPEPMLPIPGARISQRFGSNASYYAKYGLKGHNGVDLAAPRSEDYLAWHGTPVQAVEDGRAVWVYDEGGYGLYVYIYSATCDWLYAHLSEVLVMQNQQVKRGQIIGRVGYTGNTEPTGVRGTHLHWGKRPKPYQLSNGYRGYIDPLK
jgi:murein DD-endopeptidase MepM/ murein hydrolase activator NlpD